MINIFFMRNWTSKKTDLSKPMTHGVMTANFSFSLSLPRLPTPSSSYLVSLLVGLHSSPSAPSLFIFPTPLCLHAYHSVNKDHSPPFPSHWLSLSPLPLPAPPFLTLFAPLSICIHLTPPLYPSLPSSHHPSHLHCPQD